MAKPLGILGGTFDPVHHGHLRLALEVYENLGLGEVRLIPLYSPPHRGRPAADAAQRLAMLRLAIDGVSGLLADDREIKRGGISYTIDTLTGWRQESAGQPLCLIIGMDAFQGIHTWHRWTELLDHAHMILVDRPGNEAIFEHGEVEDLFKKHAVEDYAVLRKKPAGAIFKTATPLLDISSTHIRRLIAAGRDPRYLLPDGVIEYIQRNRLYLETG